VTAGENQWGAEAGKEGAAAGAACH
jgi:hypothetical protein